MRGDWGVYAGGRPWTAQRRLACRLQGPDGQPGPAAVRACLSGSSGPLSQTAVTARRAGRARARACARAFVRAGAGVAVGGGAGGEHHGRDARRSALLHPRQVATRTARLKDSERGGRRRFLRECKAVRADACQVVRARAHALVDVPGRARARLCCPCACPVSVSACCVCLYACAFSPARACHCAKRSQARACAAGSWLRNLPAVGLFSFCYIRDRRVLDENLAKVSALSRRAGGRERSSCETAP